MVVAVDGPSDREVDCVPAAGAGLGARYLDTGAMYRAVTYAVLQADVDPQDADTVTKVAVSSVLVIVTDPADPHTTLDGVNVDGPIRGSEVTAAVSAVSAVPGVRQFLVGRQRGCRPPGHRRHRGRGRDIGTVVAGRGPRVYLTASAHEGAGALERAADSPPPRPTWPGAIGSTRPGPPSRWPGPTTPSCSIRPNSSRGSWPTW
jgi:cytidylate kinase